MTLSPLLRRATIPLVSLLLMTPNAHATARLSLIESSPSPTTETDPNRIIPFVELIDEDNDNYEYSVPYVTSLQAKKVVADEQTSWQNFQDTMHWALQVGVNPDITTLTLPGLTYSARMLNCTLQITADADIAIAQKIAGQTWITTPDAKDMPALPLSNLGDKSKQTVNNSDISDGSWADDGINLKGISAPRVQRSNYCGYSSNKLVSDILQGVYVPAINECTPAGCVSTPKFPLPSKINYKTLADRLNSVCKAANSPEAKKYQKTNLTSVAKNLPLAIHWNGVMTPSGDGLSSGVSMSPVIASTKSDITAFTKSLKAVSTAETKMPLYLTGNLPPMPNIGEMQDTNAPKVGISELETYKRYLAPSDLDTQESMGYASFFQTWQQGDTVADYRPLVYWTTAYNCYLLVCTPLPIPLPAPSGLITSTGILNNCLFASAAPTGTTIFAASRFHSGMISIPEGYTVPNVSQHPILRPGSN